MKRLDFFEYQKPPSSLAPWKKQGIIKLVLCLSSQNKIILLIELGLHVIYDSCNFKIKRVKAIFVRQGEVKYIPIVPIIGLAL